MVDKYNEKDLKKVTGGSGEPLDLLWERGETDGWTLKEITDICDKFELFIKDGEPHSCIKCKYGYYAAPYVVYCSLGQ